MSREDVEAFRRGVDAYNRRDADAVLEVLDPEVEWYDAFREMFGRKATTIRGHQEVLESDRKSVV